MSPDDFALALRVLDAPVFLDDHGVAGPLGVEFTATTSDGKSVLVTQLSPALNSRVTNPDAFVRALERNGYQGAGITESGQLYLLELPPQGASLAQRLAASGPFPAAELLVVARAAVDVLARSGPDGEPHGMVTPSTLYTTGAGAVSFRWPGLLSALRAAGVDGATIGRELGITIFIAPEVQQGALLDARADVFALGATLYTALTGRPPFGGRTTATVMAAVLADDAAPSTIAADQLTAVLLRAIERDPGDRWNDIDHLREALGASLTPVRARPALGPAARRGCRGTALLVVAAGLVLWLVAQYIS